MNKTEEITGKDATIDVKDDGIRTKGNFYYYSSQYNNNINYLYEYATIISSQSLVLTIENFNDINLPATKDTSKDISFKSS